MHVVETDEPNGPLNIGALRLDRAVVDSENPKNFIQTLWLLIFGRSRNKILLRQ